MANIFEGFRTVTNNFNLLGLGQDLFILAVLIGIILATTINNKDKLLLGTLIMATFSILGLWTSAYIVLINMGLAIIVAVNEVKGDTTI